MTQKKELHQYKTTWVMSEKSSTLEPSSQLPGSLKHQNIIFPVQLLWGFPWQAFASSANLGSGLQETSKYPLFQVWHFFFFLLLLHLPFSSSIFIFLSPPPPSSSFRLLFSRPPSYSFLLLILLVSPPRSSSASSFQVSWACPPSLKVSFLRKLLYSSWPASKAQASVSASPLLGLQAFTTAPGSFYIGSENQALCQLNHFF